MKLLVLHCPECNQPLSPDNDDLVLACEHCQTILQIDEQGVTRMQIEYAAPLAGVEVRQWRPFWIFKGQVHILQRETQGGRGSAQKESAQLWSQSRYLYVPAWSLSLREAQEIGSAMIQGQPIYQPAPQPARLDLDHVTISADDALKLLEFIILAIEARRSDWLKKLDFRIEIEYTNLWALPTNESKIIAIETTEGQRA